MTRFRTSSERRAVRRALAGLAATLAVGAPFDPACADAVAGRDKAQACAACHGTDGLSKIPNAPNIAGQPETYLTEQLDAYRSGKRENEMMSIIAKDLSDADIEDLAAWYASIEVTATEPN